MEFLRSTEVLLRSSLVLSSPSRSGQSSFCVVTERGTVVSQVPNGIRHFLYLTERWTPRFRLLSRQVCSSLNYGILESICQPSPFLSQPNCPKEQERFRRCWYGRGLLWHAVDVK